MTLTNPEAGKILESLEKFKLEKTTEAFKDECESLNLNPQGRSKFVYIMSRFIFQRWDHLGTIVFYKL